MIGFERMLNRLGYYRQDSGWVRWHRDPKDFERPLIVRLWRLLLW